MRKFYKELSFLFILAFCILSTFQELYSETRKNNLDKVLWLDATHRFDEIGRTLSKRVKKETKQEYAKRKRMRMPEPKQYKIGDREKFWTSNLVTNSFEQLEAELKAIGKHCYIFVGVDEKVSESTIEKLVNEFDNKIYPTNTSIFGSEWKPGIDGDERIYLLMYDIKDGFTPSSGGVVSGGFVAGYFFPADQFLQNQIPENIPVKSNEKEILYLDTNPANPESEFYYTVISHEFQHMIHFNNDPQEYIWLNEGCSQIAPYFCGYGHANQILAYIKYPDNSLVAWSREYEIANYGHVYLWNYYIVNKLLTNRATQESFFKELVADTKRGADSYNNLFRKYNLDNFEKVYHDFAITNFVNNKHLDDGKYYYEDNLLSKLKLPVSGVINELPSTVDGKVFVWSTDGIKVDIKNAKSKVKIKFKGQRIKFDENRYTTFKVSVIMLNSKIPTKLEIKNLEIDNSLEGILEIRNDKTYDQLLILVNAQASLNIPDNIYAKLPGVLYRIEVSDEGLVMLARQKPSINLAKFSEDIGTLKFYISSNQVVSNLPTLDEYQAMIFDENIKTLKFDTVRNVKLLLENKEYNKVKDAVNILVTSNKQHNGIYNDLIKDIYDIVKFYEMQEGNSEISDIITKLKE